MVTFFFILILFNRKGRVKEGLTEGDFQGPGEIKKPSIYCYVF